MIEPIPSGYVRLSDSFCPGMDRDAATFARYLAEVFPEAAPRVQVGEYGWILVCVKTRFARRAEDFMCGWKACKKNYLSIAEGASP